MTDREYTDIEVLSIAANGRGMSFSSDTGMAECLVVARKLYPDETPKALARFTSLSHRPQGFRPRKLTLRQAYGRQPGQAH